MMLDQYYDPDTGGQIAMHTPAGRPMTAVERYNVSRERLDRVRHWRTVCLSVVTVLLYCAICLLVVGCDTSPEGQERMRAAAFQTMAITAAGMQSPTVCTGSRTMLVCR